MSINLFSSYNTLLSKYKCGLEEEQNVLTEPVLIKIENVSKDLYSENISKAIFQINNAHAGNISTASSNVFIFFIIYLETGNYNFNYTSNTDMYISFSGSRITDKPENGNYDIKSGMYYVCINFSKVINKPLMENSLIYTYQYNNSGSYVSLDNKILKCTNMSMEDKLNYNYMILNEECGKNPTTELCKNYYMNTPSIRKDLDKSNVPKSISNYFNGVMNFLDYYDTNKNNNYPTYTAWVDYNNCPTKCGKGFRGRTRYETSLLPMQSGTATILQREDINCDINCDKETLWSHAWLRAAQCSVSTVPTSFKTAFPNIDELGVDGTGGDADIQVYRTKLNLTPWSLGNNPTNSAECYGSTWSANTSFKINTRYYSQNGSTYMIYTNKLFEIVFNGVRAFSTTTTGNYTSLTFNNTTWTNTNTRGYTPGAQYQILRLVSDNKNGELNIDSEYLRLSELTLRNGRLEIIQQDRILKYIGSPLIWYNGLSLWTPFMFSVSNLFDFSNECRVFSSLRTQYIRFHLNGSITVYRSSDNANLGGVAGSAYSRTYVISTPRGSSTNVAVENVSFKNNSIVLLIRTSTTSASDRTMSSSAITTFLGNSSFANNLSYIENINSEGFFNNKSMQDSDSVNQENNYNYNILLFIVILLVISVIIIFLKRRKNRMLIGQQKNNYLYNVMNNKK
jgi:hypothetical protein